MSIEKTCKIDQIQQYLVIKLNWEKPRMATHAVGINAG